MKATLLSNTIKSNFYALEFYVPNYLSTLICEIVEALQNLPGNDCLRMKRRRRQQRGSRAVATQPVSSRRDPDSGNKKARLFASPPPPPSRRGAGVKRRWLRFRRLLRQAVLGTAYLWSNTFFVEEGPVTFNASGNTTVLRFAHLRSPGMPGQPKWRGVTRSPRLRSRRRRVHSDVACGFRSAIGSSASSLVAQMSQLPSGHCGLSVPPPSPLPCPFFFLSSSHLSLGVKYHCRLSG